MNVQQIITRATPILKDAGIKQSAIFGSYVRNEERSDSDIDILIEPPEGLGLFAFVELKNKLEQALNKKVDLVTYNSLHPFISESILKEQLRIL